MSRWSRCTAITSQKSGIRVFQGYATDRSRGELMDLGEDQSGLVDEVSASQQRIEKIRRYVSRVPSLSTTVVKVMETCNNPDASANDLNRVISLDPVLTGQVLKLINSAYYSLKTRVTSLTRAIIILGMNTIKNMALSMSVMASVKGTAMSDAFSIDQYWAHSICVGVTAKRLAETMEIPLIQREEYFVGGLLHDLGKIPISYCFPDEYLLISETVARGKLSLQESEKEMFGFDHCGVGKIVVEAWGLSEKLQDALRWHHFPNGAGVENRGFVETIALADAFAKIIIAQSPGDCAGAQSTIAVLLGKLEINPESLSGLRETVNFEMDKAKVFLQITQGD